MPYFSVFISKDQKEYLDNLVTNKSGFITAFIKLLQSGELDLSVKDGKITQNQTTDKQLDRNTKIARIIWLQTRSESNRLDIKLKEIAINFAETQGAHLSQSGSRMLKKAITEPPAKQGKLIHNDSIWCYICNEQFQFTDLTLFAQKENFHDHLNNAHNLIMPKHIEQELTELHSE